MLLEDTIKEFLLELDIREASKITIRSYKNVLKVFNDYMCDNTNLIYNQWHNLGV